MEKITATISRVRFYDGESKAWVTIDAWSRVKAQDALCRAVYGDAWSLEQAATLLEAVDTYISEHRS